MMMQPLRMSPSGNTSENGQQSNGISVQKQIANDMISLFPKLLESTRLILLSRFQCVIHS